jgi:hypothetical protein
MSETVGKATITGESGAGLYTVSLDYGTEYVTNRIAEIDEQISRISTDILEISSRIIANDNAANVLRGTLDAKINALNSAPIGDQPDLLKEVAEAAKAVIETEKKVSPDRVLLRSKELQRSSLELKKSELQSIPLTESRNVWCADYTEEATGECATIEINGEQPQILLAPGAPLPSPSNGQLQHRLAMPASATYYNSAILPGWQKYKPTFRTGTLIDIDRDNNLGIVILESDTSSAQGLAINQTTTLSDVPFEYLNCNNLAFQVGDEVVIQFVNQEWSNPKIIGFKSNPRVCGPARIIVPLAFTDNGVSAFPSSGLQSKSVWQTDFQYSSCVGGQLFITDTGGSPPPGYIAGGSFANALTTDYDFVPQYGAGEFLSDPSQYSDLGVGSFKWEQDYEIIGGSPILTFSPGASLGAALEQDGLGQIRVDEWVTLVFTGTLISDIRVERRNFFFDTSDTEENQPVIDCIKDEFSRFISEIPQTISLKPVGSSGSAGVSYQFYRFYADDSIAASDDAPASMFAGLCLGYRRADL